VVEYKPGKLNGAADALSRREELASVFSLILPTFQLFDKLRAELATDTQAAEIRTKLANGTMWAGWTEVDGLLLFKGKIFIPDASELWATRLADAHAVAMRVSKRPYIGVEFHFIIHTRLSELRNLSEVAAYVKETNPSTYIQLGCCSLFQCLLRFGVIFLWTLLRDFRKWVVNQ
jgi:hypothetical protein